MEGRNMEAIKARIIILKNWIGNVDLANDPLAGVSLDLWNKELLGLKQELNKGIVNGLISGSKANSFIDDTQIAALFEQYASAVSTFERTGIDTLSAKLQEEINSDGTFKDLLISHINAEKTTTVFQTITTAFNNN